MTCTPSRRSSAAGRVAGLSLPARVMVVLLIFLVLCVVGFFVAIGAVLFMSYVSVFNAGNKMEQGIKATYANNQNILAQYSQKVMEASQVPEMARDDIVKVAKAAIEGRYGPDGSKAQAAVAAVRRELEKIAA